VEKYFTAEFLCDW